MPARPPDLRSQAVDFAGRISDLLNRTVAHGIRISVILQDDGQVGWVGYRITKQEPFPGRGIPLTLEELVTGRSSWKQAVEEHRAWFHRIQLKAAVRDDPEAVREELRRLEEIERQPKRYC